MSLIYVVSVSRILFLQKRLLQSFAIQSANLKISIRVGLIKIKISTNQNYNFDQSKLNFD